jgi:hypothetical protein
VPKITHLLGSRLTVGGEVVNLMPRPRFTHAGRFVLLISVKRLSQLQGHTETGRIGIAFK